MATAPVTFEEWRERADIYDAFEECYNAHRALSKLSLQAAKAFAKNRFKEALEQIKYASIVEVMTSTELSQFLTITHAYADSVLSEQLSQEERTSYAVVIEPMRNNCIGPQTPPGVTLVRRHVRPTN